MTGAVVFDLDGTLIDSAPDLHAALNKVLEGEGARPVTLAEAQGFIGHGIPNLVQEAREALNLPAGRQAAMAEAMLRHYLAAPAALTRPYPGAVDFLQLLRDHGHPLGLCTNKALAPTLAILDALDLRRFFDVVVAGDSLPQKKPDPAPLLATFAPLGAPLCSIGDSEVDAETAARAGVRFGLHLRGYRKAPPCALRHGFAFDSYDPPRLYAALTDPAGI